MTLNGALRARIRRARSGAQSAYPTRKPAIPKALLSVRKTTTDWPRATISAATRPPRHPGLVRVRLGPGQRRVREHRELVVGLVHHQQRHPPRQGFEHTSRDGRAGGLFGAQTNTARVRREGLQHRVHTYGEGIIQRHGHDRRPRPARNQRVEPKRRLANDDLIVGSEHLARE